MSFRNYLGVAVSSLWNLKSGICNKKKDAIPENRYEISLHGQLPDSYLHEIKLELSRLKKTPQEKCFPGAFHTTP